MENCVSCACDLMSVDVRSSDVADVSIQIRRNTAVGDCLVLGFEEAREPAGEAPIQGIDRDHLVTAVRARGHRQVVPLPAQPELAGIVKGLARPGDYVVCLGAGNITQWAYSLEGELKALG